LKSNDDTYLNADSAKQLRTDSHTQGEGMAGHICHALLSQSNATPQNSKVINTDFYNKYPLSDLET